MSRLARQRATCSSTASAPTTHRYVSCSPAKLASAPSSVVALERTATGDVVAERARRRRGSRRSAAPAVIGEAAGHREAGPQQRAEARRPCRRRGRRRRSRAGRAPGQRTSTDAGRGTSCWPSSRSLAGDELAATGSRAVSSSSTTCASSRASDGAEAEVDAVPEGEVRAGVLALQVDARRGRRRPCRRGWPSRAAAARWRPRGARCRRSRPPPSRAASRRRPASRAAAAPRRRSGSAPGPRTARPSGSAA